MAATKTQVDREAKTRIPKAMSHPLRQELFTIINDRVASPNGCARELDVSLNDAAYHMRALWKLDCAEVVDTRQRRGATEHFYKATRRSFLDISEWAALPDLSRSMVTDAITQRIIDDYTASLKAGLVGGRDEGKFHMTRTPITVDREGRDRVLEILEETRERILDEEQASKLRMRESGEPATPMSSSHVCITMPSTA
jgi:hypothetical protein